LIFLYFRFPKEAVWHTADIFARQDGNKLTGKLVTKPVVVGGDYMGIVIPFSGEKLSTDDPRQFSATYIRILFGELIARELHAEVVIDLSTGSTMHEGRAGFVAKRCSEFFPEFIHDREIVANCIHAKPAALAMLDAGFYHRNSYTFFLFSWIALETQIGGDGRDRRKFCMEELKSETCNQEMLRFWGLRQQIFHKGDAIEITVFDRYSLLTLILLTMLGPGAARDRILEVYTAKVDAARPQVA
jgi:hypothetical protein